MSLLQSAPSQSLQIKTMNQLVSQPSYHSTTHNQMYYYPLKSSEMDCKEIISLILFMQVKEGARNRMALKFHAEYSFYS